MKVTSLDLSAHDDHDHDHDDEESSAPGARSPLWSVTLAALCAAGLALW